MYRSSWIITNTNMAASTRKLNKRKYSNLCQESAALITDPDSGDEDIDMGEDMDENESDNYSSEYDSDDNLPLARTILKPRLGSNRSLTQHVNLSTAGPGTSNVANREVVKNDSETGGEAPQGNSDDDMQRDDDARQQGADGEQQEADDGGQQGDDAGPGPPRRRRQVQQTATFDWQKMDTLTPQNIVYYGQEGINVPVPGTGTQFDYFSMYWDDVIFLSIAVETNRFAEQYIAATDIGPKSNVKNWTPTDPDELRVFFGLLLLIGILYNPRLDMYWSKDELYDTPLFSQVLTHDCVLF